MHVVISEKADEELKIVPNQGLYSCSTRTSVKDALHIYAAQPIPNAAQP